MIAIEKQRQQIQIYCDNSKTLKQRNLLGQYSTPVKLANDIFTYTKELFSSDNLIRFLDPAAGTGVFFSVLQNTFSIEKIKLAEGYEIDEHYGKPAHDIWKNTFVSYKLEDFTKSVAPENNSEKFNLLICNPPYVRHHHIPSIHKTYLQTKIFDSIGIKLSGLSGMYCYFMMLAHSWMQADCVAVWLIPSEFMDVNYGQAIREYLLNEVTLLRIHRFTPNDVQFDDALVSSAIVWLKNKKPPENNKVVFTYGGTVNAPIHKKEISAAILLKEKKWTRFPLLSERIASDKAKLSDFFTIKRGIATGHNKYFILSLNEILKRDLPLSQFKPILPNPKNLNQNVINTDSDGIPQIENPLFVLNCELPFDEVKNCYPNLYQYLLKGIEDDVSKRYLCEKRKLWYAQENRPESFFYCTYIGRSDDEKNKPFRFVLNYSKAIVSNSYLILYPKKLLADKIINNPELCTFIFDELNNITRDDMLNESRVYGGGMYKIEPKELGNVCVSDLAALLG
ncbi:MAG: class I SAM-dependent methyltransferase [Methylococcaceae bacterium]